MDRFLLYYKHNLYLFLEPFKKRTAFVHIKVAMKPKTAVKGTKLNMGSSLTVLYRMFIGLISYGCSIIGLFIALKYSWPFLCGFISGQIEN